MIAQSSNPRDTYYSTIFDEYIPEGNQVNNSSNKTWNNGTKTVKGRPSLNLHPHNSSISSLKKQPSFDCPSPSSQNYQSPLASIFSYTTNNSSYSNFSSTPSQNFLYSNRGSKDSSGTGSVMDEDRINSLTVPYDARRGVGGGNNGHRTPSPSGSSIHEDQFSYTRPSSASSFEDLTTPTKILPPKITSSRPYESSPNSNHVNGVNENGIHEDRDQYGFKINYQWITHKEYMDFEASYSSVLSRRKAKWETVISEHGGAIPGRNSKMKRYVRKGIPPSMRGRVWFHYSGAEQKMKEQPDLYEKLIIKSQDPKLENEYIEIIERDLHRTFPENIKFKSTTKYEDDTTLISTENVPIIQSLRRVLTAFSLYSPNIGYCQSLNYVAGILLLFMDEEKAFWTLVTIIHDYLPENMYDVTMEGANVDQAVLMMFIMERMPHIWNKLSSGFSGDPEKLDANMPTITLVTSHWFLTLYINILPIETLLRVWDCFFYEGNKILFRIALAIFKMNEDKILTVGDPMEIFQVVQNMPKRLVDCQKLIDICFRRRRHTTDVSQREINRRREFFRERRKKKRVSIIIKP